MSELKRRFSFSFTSTDRFKRSRSKFFCANIIQHVILLDIGYTCFEDLPNELIYEVFDYLDGCSIYQAFGRLNNRLETLVNCSIFPLKINFSRKSQTTLEQECRNVIIPNRHRLLSIHLYSQPIISRFFDYCNIDESFTCLQSIILHGLSAQKLLASLFYFNFLPKLTSLIIQLEDDYYYNFSDIYRLIFRLPALKYSQISVSDCEESDLNIPLSINGKTSTIEHLVMKFPCTIPELTSLLQHTPHLKCLVCDKLVETDKIDIENKDQLILPHLTNVSFNDCDIDFDDFKLLIKKMSSQLRILRLKTSSFLNYLDPRQWKQLIKKHMPHLTEFHFDCSINMEFMPPTDILPNSETINMFTSEFWLERHCFFEFTTEDNEFIYSLHTNKKSWFDDPLSDQILDSNLIELVNISYNQRSNTTTSRPIQLSISGFTVDTWEQKYIDSMKPCFTGVEFTYLNINCNGLPIAMFIEIIHLLPNLLSLELSSFTKLQSNSLSFEDYEMILVISITNKITKVKVDKVETIDQMDLLMNLCRRMRYLEVEYTTDNDLEKVIGSISLSGDKRALDLCSLCVCTTSRPNEEVVETLHTMIDFERLFQHENKIFRNYVIQRRKNKVFLYWNRS